MATKRPLACSARSSSRAMAASEPSRAAAVTVMVKAAPMFTAPAGNASPATKVRGTLSPVVAAASTLLVALTLALMILAALLRKGKAQ